MIACDNLHHSDYVTRVSAAHKCAVDLAHVHIPSIDVQIQIVELKLVEMRTKLFEFAQVVHNYDLPPQTTTSYASSQNKINVVADCINLEPRDY